MESVIKGLTVTKPDYIKLIKDTKKIISRATKDELEKEQIAELYGIYYNAIAGLIRSGVMFSKTMELDGSSTLHIMAGENDIDCPDAPIRNIFKEEYSDVVVPFKDDSISFMGGGFYAPTDTLDSYTGAEILDEEPQEEIIESAKKSKKAKDIEEEEEFEEFEEFPDDEEEIEEFESFDDESESLEYDNDIEGTQEEVKSYTEDDYLKDELTEIVGSISSIRNKCIVQAICMATSLAAVIVALIIL